MDSDRTSLLVPLSSVDQAGVESSLSVLAYVVSAEHGFDAPALRAACLRLVEKWRLLAGALVWVPEASTYAVRVPLGPIDPEERLHFTEATEKSNMSLEGGEMGGQQEAKTVKTPAMKYFVHKDTQGALASLARSSKPILNVHVTHFKDYTCVGIAVPHGVFDGTGHGALTQYLDAELHGREYTPPPLQTSNILQAVFDEFNANPETSAPSDKHMLMLDNLKRELVQSGVRTVAALAGRVGYEYLWHKAEDRALYLGRDVIERIVSRVKADVKKADPNAWVSTGDVLYMWAVQTAYADEAPDEHHAVSMMSAVSMRPLLTELNKDFATYPHNCLVPAAFPLTDKASTKSASLAGLALMHRRGIDAMRNLDYIQAWSRHVNVIGSSVPDRRWRHDSWICTNQTVSKSTEIVFPGMNGSRTDIVGFFFYFTPILPDHTIMMNELNGGYILQGPLRRSRWRAIDRALVELMK